MFLPILIFGFVSLSLADWTSDLVDFHNEKRSKVALGEERDAGGAVPSASYMAKVTWDSGLAAEAQRYADRCVYGHDYNRGDGIGENIAYDSRKDSYMNMANAWYDEVNDARISDYEAITSGELGSSPAIGHYTQIIWYTSGKLGCGYAPKCSMGEYLVCRYRPNGNTYGQPVLEKGSPCSKCDGSCNKGLCDGGIKGGACVDKYTNCNELKTWCDKDDSIAKDCRKTCTGGKCDDVQGGGVETNEVTDGGGGGSGNSQQNTNPNCVDADPSCENWSMYCSSNQYTKDNCPRTCGTC